MAADHPYSPMCGCPGCQFLWAAEERFKKFGPPPVIGTFDPETGDVGRDCDSPVSPYRTWTGEAWHPYFGVRPKMTQEQADATMRRLLDNALRVGTALLERAFA